MLTESQSKQLKIIEENLEKIEPLEQEWVAYFKRKFSHEEDDIPCQMSIKCLNLTYLKVIK
jgi:hypothetical protein